MIINPPYGDVKKNFVEGKGRRVLSARWHHSLIPEAMGLDYEVTLAGKPMGRAQAEKQGLYYHVVCRAAFRGMCVPTGISAGEKKTNLGILVPMDARVRPGHPVSGEPGRGGRTAIRSAAKA